MYALEILRNRTKEVKALRKGDSFLMYSLSKKNVINRPIGPVVNDSECYRAIKAYIFTQANTGTRSDSVFECYLLYHD